MKVPAETAYVDAVRIRAAARNIMTIARLKHQVGVLVIEAPENGEDPFALFLSIITPVTETQAGCAA